MVALTVVVITKNEERNIEDCLKSVHGWADEVIVVDDESKDRTIEIAQKLSTKIYHRKMDNEGTHRNWAYQQSKNEWVLSLDADERATKELKEEISETLAKPECDVYSIPRRNYIGNFWVKHGGQYPAAQLRLFRKQSFKYEEVGVHPRAFVEGKIGHLKKDIIHHSYRDFEHFVAKLNGQTTLEAQKWFNNKRQMSLGRAIWRAMDRFPRTYFGKQGYKDGFMGFMLSFFKSLYEIMSYAKYWELKRRHANG